MLRDSDDGRNLREYLIATAARLIGERGSAGLAVRDIAREAQVADGVLYNYFEDKEDLLVHALLAHVGAVMAAMQPMPPPGSGTVAGNLRQFIDAGLATLARVAPAFAGLLAQPKVLTRFHDMVGGARAFGADTGDDGNPPPAETAQEGNGGQGLPAILRAYLTAEQQLGRIDGAADIEATVSLVVGAIHGQVLPQVMFSPPGTQLTWPADLAARLADTVLSGIAPGRPQA
ncbi:MAG TPA: TetR/AcrR family transcriptional regulator [Streptosporangiaceae bacterium]